MTNPFRVDLPPFPHIQPGQVIQDPGLGGYVSEGLAGVLKAMHDRERLDRERAEFKSKQAYYATSQEGQRLDNEKKRRESAEERRKLAAEATGSASYTSWVSSGARFEDLGRFTSKINSPLASQDFVNRVLKHNEAVNQGALTRGNIVDTDVRSTTSAALIGRAQSDALNAATQAAVNSATSVADIQNAAAIARANQAAAITAQANAARVGLPDVQQQNIALEEWKLTGATLKSVYDKHRLPVPAGEDGSKRFDPTVTSRGMATWKATQKQAAGQVLVANSQINELLNQGVRIGRLTPIKDAVPFDQGRGTIPQAEQQLLSAGGVLSSQYILATSGKAATDKEREELKKQIIPRAGDKPETLQQKALLREMVVQITFDASQGSTQPLSQIVASVMSVAKARGASRESMKFLDKSRMDALLLERQQATTGGAPLIVGDDAPDADSVQAYFDSLGRR